MIKKIRM